MHNRYKNNDLGYCIANNSLCTIVVGQRLDCLVPATELRYLQQRPCAKWRHDMGTHRAHVFKVRRLISGAIYGAHAHIWSPIRQG